MEAFSEFLDKENVFAVVGVSKDKDKYGYKVFKHLLSEGFKVYGVNPKYEDIDGEKIYPSLVDIPEKVDVAVLIVPPKVSYKIIEQARSLGINKVWFQPGSESKEAIDLCSSYNIREVHNACIVVDGLKQEFYL